jgi:hypothetical protein
VTEREERIFDELLAALKSLVTLYGTWNNTHADTPEIARAKNAIAEAESLERGHLTTED